ncbi:MAG: cell wall hydrolase [Bacillota bacterium]
MKGRTVEAPIILCLLPFPFCPSPFALPTTPVRDTIAEGKDLVLSRKNLRLLFLTAVITMWSLAPWPVTVRRNQEAKPIVPARPVAMRPLPRPASPPTASRGKDGPQAPTPHAPAVSSAVPRTPAQAAAAARTAARQRYLNAVSLLGHLIYGEARGEPYIGQVAVGAVVMNRVESPLFPNTIPEVIFQPGAFDAVTDGQIYLTPDEEAIRAAKAAIAGWDPIGGALYYYNPARTTNEWIWTRPVVMVIGNHYFAR